MSSIDARGLSCPQPVLLAKKAMESSEGVPVEITVDSAVAVENISRAAAHLGWEAAVAATDDESVVTLTKK
jgi:TusA-related sulfurtransferase